jgi:hypothetical protein
MADQDVIIVQIVGDISSLKTSVSEANGVIDSLKGQVSDLSSRLDSLKGSTAGGAAGVDAIDHTIARMAGRITFEALPGMGRMGMLIERLGVQAAGAAPALAALAPVAVVVGLYELHEQAEKAEASIRKMGDEGVSTSGAMFELAEKEKIENLRLEDQVGILENRPARNKVLIALEESRAKAFELATQLESTTGKLLELVEAGGTVSLWHGLLTGKETTGGLSEAVRPALEALDDAQAELRRAEEEHNEKRIAAAKADIEKHQREVLVALGNEEMRLNQERATVMAHAGPGDTSATRAMEEDRQRPARNMIADMREAITLQREAAAEGAKTAPLAAQAASDQEAKATQAKADAYARLKAQLSEMTPEMRSYLEVEREIRKEFGSAPELEQLNLRRFLNREYGETISLMREEKSLKWERPQLVAPDKEALEKDKEDLRKRIEAEKEGGMASAETMVSGAKDPSVQLKEMAEDEKYAIEKRYVEEIGALDELSASTIAAQLEALEAKHQQRMAEIKSKAAKEDEDRDKREADKAERERDKETAEIQRALMTRNGLRNFFATQANAIILKTAEMEIASTTRTKNFSIMAEEEKLAKFIAAELKKLAMKLMGKAMDDTPDPGLVAADRVKVASQAGVAAAAEFAQVMIAVPFPANLAEAPAMAAAAFAQAMSFGAFEKGGIHGETGMFLGHAEEMTLPSHLSNFIQRAAAHEGGGGGTTINGGIHYSPVISEPFNPQKHGAEMMSFIKGKMSRMGVSIA